jgi:hypothetical protein
LEAKLSGTDPHMYAPLVSGINALAVYNSERDQVTGLPMTESKPSQESLPSFPPSPPESKITPSSESPPEYSFEADMKRISIDNPTIAGSSPLTPSSPILEEYPEYSVVVGNSPPLDIQRWTFGINNVADESRLLFKNAKDQKACKEFRSRKSWLGKVDRREQIQITAQNIYCVDFYDCYFDHQKFALNLPGFSLDAFSYWDGKQPLRYVCKTRDGQKVFWCFQFEWIPRSEYPGLSL